MDKPARDYIHRLCGRGPFRTRRSGRQGKPVNTMVKAPSRILSIDLLRGSVMVLMALDHVRDFFHAEAFLYDPMDLESTTVPVYLTRWVTHFCAPVFVLLAGTSVRFMQGRSSIPALSTFLLKRGLWLIAIEVLVVNFAWFFNPSYPVLALGVIWAIGFSMIALAGLIHLPFKAIVATGALLVLGHDLLNGLHPDGAWWMFLHERNAIQLAAHTIVFVYPVLPWIGVMALGYCAGSYYTADIPSQRRRGALLAWGWGMVVAFLLLRGINVYGDPHPWEAQDSWTRTVLSFLDLAKYPPSLLYLLMTLGPAFLFLAVSERWRGGMVRALIVIGRVPFFYYLVHIFAIHLVAMVAAELTGFGWRSMVLDVWVNIAPALQGYGFDLAVVYLIWCALVLALFPLCRWYDRLKSRNRHLWWLSYL